MWLRRGQRRAGLIMKSGSERVGSVLRKRKSEEGKWKI